MPPKKSPDGKKPRKNRTPPSQELIDFVKKFATSFIDIDEKKRDEFLQYSRNEFGLSPQEYQNELDEAGLSPSAIHKLLDTLSNRLKKEGKLTKALGNFGESVCSWHMTTQRKFLLFRYSWHKHPFDTETGIDVCAIDLTSMHVAFIEVKTGQTKASATSQFRELIEQIQEYEKNNTLRSGANAHNQIMKRLAAMIRDNKVPTEVTTASLFQIDPTDYKRIGFVLTPEKIKYDSLGVAANANSASNLHELNIASLKKIEDWLNAWLIEAGLAEQGGKFS